jgi:hypothetical protein
MRESRTYGSVRGACDETHVPTATVKREGGSELNFPAVNSCIWPWALPRSLLCVRPCLGARLSVAAGADHHPLSRGPSNRHHRAVRLGRPFVIENRTGAAAISAPKSSCDSVHRAGREGLRAAARLSAAAPFLTASGELEPHNFRRQPIATAPPLSVAPRPSITVSRTKPGPSGSKNSVRRPAAAASATRPVGARLIL